MMLRVLEDSWDRSTGNDEHLSVRGRRTDPLSLVSSGVLPTSWLLILLFVNTTLSYNLCPPTPLFYRVAT